jgi:uncharacterized RDD family membrane protein YckC
MASKNIDIRTPQNVVVSFELATAANRVFGNFIDALIVTALHFWAVQNGWISVNPSIFLMRNPLFIWLYHLVFVAFFNGRTIGMRLFKIAIVNPGGGNVVFEDLFLRWIMRPLDITFTLGGLGFFMMLGSEKRQRLGDMLAGTVLVSMKHKVHFSLSDIVEFHEKNRSDVVNYPAVKYLLEADVLNIKNLIHNEQGYHTSVHQELIQQSALKLATLLGLQDVPENKIAFLQTVVNDYIVITR